ncbi:MAG: ATP-binding cassette domain-containing protein, partial [Planctomycetes bacterium]|nr:ATP-binding cassette domain-containing protein [Planctomycetota bacterium]
MQFGTKRAQVPQRSVSQRGYALDADPAPTVVEIENFNLWYGQSQALYDVNLDIKKNRVTALIGPSGCGKSTLLRSINRMNDLIDVVRYQGSIRLGGHDIYAKDQDVIELRKHCGMVFQKSNPFPKSI